MATDLMPTTATALAERARARTDAIRASFEAGLQGLAESLQDGDWLHLGYESAVAWFEAEFADLPLVGKLLPRPAFKALAGAYVAQGTSTRVTAERLGVSASAVSAATRDVERPAKTKGRDGRERTVAHLRAVPDLPAAPEVVEGEVVADVVTVAPHAEPAPWVRSQRDREVLVLVAARGELGLTVQEARELLPHLHHGQVSAALSRLWHRHAAVQPGEHRRMGAVAWVLQPTD